MIQEFACTGLSLFAKDNSFILGRTIEWGGSALPSFYVVAPKNQEFKGLTPSGVHGLSYKSVFGWVGLAVVQKEYIAEGINEAGLSCGLFYFPGYGEYVRYDPSADKQTLSDMQLVSWMLSCFKTIDEVKTAIKDIRIVSVVPEQGTATIHWRLADASGKQVVIEIINGGEVHFYDNTVGVITNAPGFQWHLTNLNNYVNLFPGSAPSIKLSDKILCPFGAGSGMLGIPGDFTPPSRFVRIAFYRATAPQLKTGFNTVMQCFHILNNFDIPIGVEHAEGEVVDIPSATQWTSVINVTERKVYFRTCYNSNIRVIDLHSINFDKVDYQYHPLDKSLQQPVEEILIVNTI